MVIHASPKDLRARQIPWIDDLVRQLADYISRARLYELFSWFSPPEPEEFESQLRDKLREFEADAKTRGWEPKR